MSKNKKVKKKRKKLNENLPPYLEGVSKKKMAEAMMNYELQRAIEKDLE